MRKHTILFILVAFVFASSQVFAQRYTKSKRYTSIGGSLNAMNYFGDITPTSSFTSADIQFTRPNLSVHIMRRLTPRFSARAAFAWGRLKGDDFVSADPSDRDGRYRYIRNAHFRNDIKELSVVGMLDLFENRNTFLRRPDFVPYAFAGIAVFHHNPKARTPDSLGRNWVALQPLGTEGQFASGPGSERYPDPYRRIQIAIPAGIGFRYKLSPRIDLAFEIGYRFTFFDYLDDVSGNYPDMGDLGSNLARAMSDRTLETISANTGDSREATLNRVFNDTGLRPITFTGSDGRLYETVNGYAKNVTTRDGQRGKPSENDWYLVTGFHINYILIRGVRCPKFR
jgi:hypothetical protein